MARLLPADPIRRGRAKLVLLAAFFLLPVAAGWVAWWLDLAPGATGNYGTLIPPQPLPAGPLDPLKGKWVLVQVDGGACDAYCERKHYYMRQVRRAQGKDMQRVERLWILTDATAPRAELLAAIEGTVVAPAGAGLAAAFPAARLAADHIYLVDPLGNLMLRFPRDPDPSRMIKDLQRLLKVSQFGREGSGATAFQVFPRATTASRLISPMICVRGCTSKFVADRRPGLCRQPPAHALGTPIETQKPLDARPVARHQLLALPWPASARVWLNPVFMKG